MIGCATQRTANEEQWLILETTEGEHPVIVSARQNLPDATTRAAFRWVATIEWRYPISGRGMPSDETLRSMRALEDQLKREVLFKGLSMHALTWTGNGLRKWMYYVTDRKVADEQFAQAAKASPAENIRVSVLEEPEWTSLQNVLANVRR
jgi:hypothetical protein